MSVTLTGSDGTGFSSTAATGVTAFKGIDVLVGGQGSGDSLTGENVASTWTVYASSGNSTYSDGTNTLTFTAFTTLNAGTRATPSTCKPGPPATPSTAAPAPTP